MLQPGVGYTFSASGNTASLVIDQPWQFWSPSHPFTIYTGKSGNDWLVYVTPGTINNQVPTMGSPAVSLTTLPPPKLNIGSALVSNPNYIYLLMPANTSSLPTVWPDQPSIIFDTAPQTDSDSQSYLLIGMVDSLDGTVTQYIGGSQWGERYKCGADDARYFYGLV
jgi:hypothetical protein